MLQAIYSLKYQCFGGNLQSCRKGTSHLATICFFQSYLGIDNIIGIPFLLELVSLERVTSKDTTFIMHRMFSKEFFDVDIR